MAQQEDSVWPQLRQHLQQTLTYWSVFFSFGLCLAFLGPTILDLRCQTQATLQQITWVFFTQQLFLLLGSCAGGLFLSSPVSSMSALFSSTFLISIVFAVIPLCRHVVTLSIAMALAGKAMGIIDTVANQQLVTLFQKDSAMVLQALHFFIGLGALVSPLVADPFLADDSCVLAANWTANSSSSPDLQHLREILAGQGAVLHNASLYPLFTEGVVVTRVAYAFWIMALINLSVPAAVLALMSQQRLLPCSGNGPPLLDKEPQPNHSHKGHGNLLSCCSPSKLRGHSVTFFILHLLAGAIVFITDGIIGSYTGFLYTYAVSPPLLMSHKAAGCLDSIFWASITAGRAVFIVLSSRFTVSLLLTFSLVGVVLVQCSLMIFYTSSVFVFVGTCMLGFCISSVFPLMLAVTEGMFNYTGSATTVLVTSASTGEMLLQLLVGSVLYSQGSYSFLLCSTVSSFIGFGLLLLLLYLQRADSAECEDMKAAVS